MYSPIAVRPIPTDRAITRSLVPQAYFNEDCGRAITEKLEAWMPYGKPN
jgi:hypothetical protein